MNDRSIRRGVTYDVIIPRDRPPVVPISCPVCDTLYRSQMDEETHRLYSCCHACSIDLIDNVEEWISGKRPSKETVVLKTSLRVIPKIDIDFLGI